MSEIQQNLRVYNKVIASYVKGLGFGWAGQYSYNGSKSKRVKFWYIDLNGSRILSRRKINRLVKDIPSIFSFVDRIELRGNFGDARCIRSAAPSIAVYYKMDLIRDVPKIHYVIEDEANTMLSFSKSEGIKFPNQDRSVSVWDKVDKPSDIVNTVNNGLILLMGENFRGYKVTLVNKDGDDLIRV